MAVQEQHYRTPTAFKLYIIKTSLGIVGISDCLCHTNTTSSEITALIFRLLSFMKSNQLNTRVFNYLKALYDLNNVITNSFKIIHFVDFQ